MGSGGKENCSKWFQQRTNMEKTFMSISVLLLITCIFIIIGFTHSGSKPDKVEEQPVCTSKECIRIAGSIIDKADFSSDPCNNFYSYACGRYAKTHNLPPGVSEVSVEDSTSEVVFSQLKHWLESSTRVNNISVYNKARILYNTCMKYDVSTERNGNIYSSMLEDLIEREKMGDWPVLSPYWDKPDYPLERRLAALTLLGIPAAFQIQIIPDKKKPGKFITRLSPGEFFLPSFDKNRIRNDQLLRLFMEHALIQLGLRVDKAASEVDDILSMEAQFIDVKRNLRGKICQDIEKEIDHPLNEFSVVRIPLKDVDRMMPELNWTKIMVYVYNTSNALPNIEIELYCRQYIREFTGLLADKSPKSVYNYLGWRFLYAFIAHLGPPFQKLYLDFQTYVNTGKLERQQQPHWKECVSIIEQYMLPVLTAVYNNQEDVKMSVKEYMKIASDIKAKSEDIILSYGWIKKKEKHRIKQKISKIEITDTKFTSSLEDINHWYSKLILHSDYLIYNVIRLQRFLVSKQMEKLSVPSDRELDRFVFLYATSPQFRSQHNFLDIFYSKLTEPYLRVNELRYFNYGGFGTYFAREIVHDLEILHSPSTVGSESHWDLVSVRVNISKCIHQQELNTKNGYILPSNLMPELLEDLSSVQISYKAYKKSGRQEDMLVGLDFTNEQMYFLSFAQIHCEVRESSDYKRLTNTTSIPSELRVNSALQNLPEFSEAFNCKSGAPMNPEQKCFLTE